MEDLIEAFKGLVQDAEEKSVCRGKIFRCRVNEYVPNKGGYAYEVKMLPLKRMSCPGCEKCGWIEDEIRECISCDTPPIIDEIEDGALYELSMTNISHDWESGHVDGYDLIFNKIKEEK